MRGRKPKPTAAKIASGNPGKRPLNTREPKVLPEPPHLSGPSPAHSESRVEALARELYELGVHHQARPGGPCCLLPGLCRWGRSREEAQGGRPASSRCRPATSRPNHG